MMPMGWNQIRQAKVADVQGQMRHNHMGQNQQQQYSHHQQMNPHTMMMHNQQAPSFDWNQQHMMHQQQMYSHPMMGHFGMQNPQMMMGIADKPPEPSEPPPPSPPAPLPNDEPPPAPPAAEQKWWESEMRNLQNMHHRNELERLSGEKWFQSMNTSQQIECWQHKLQLINKEKKVQNNNAIHNEQVISTSSQSILQSSRPAIVPAPSVSAPSPMRPQPPMQQTGDVEQDLMKAKQEEENIKQQVLTFERQYGEWRKQFEDWKDKHKAHPNKEQFAQYENQWMTWQKQMSDQKKQFDDNLASIRAQINSLEQQKNLSAQPKSAPNIPGQQISEQNPRYPFQQQQVPRQWMDQNQQKFNRSFGAMEQRPRLDFNQSGNQDFGYDNNQQFGNNQRFEGQRFENNQTNMATKQGPRFSAPGAMDNSSFQNPTPRFETPGAYNENRGQRPRFGSDMGRKGQFSANSGAPRFRNRAPPPPPSEEEYFEEENNEFDTQMHQNQGMRGPRPGFRPGFGQRGRGMGGNRFDGPRQLRPGFSNDARFRGPRPRFSGHQARLPGPRGPRPPRYGRPDMTSYNEEDIGNEEQYYDNEGFNSQNRNITANSGFDEDTFDSNNFFQGDENFNEQVEDGTPGPSRLQNKDNNKRGRGRGRGTETADYKVTRNMVPMSFGASKRNKTTNRLDTFTMHDAKTNQEDALSFTTDNNTSKINPEDDYSHYMEEYESSPASENQARSGRGLAHLLRGRGSFSGRGSARGRGRGDYGPNRGRGRGFAGRGRSIGESIGDEITPANKLINEKGQFNEGLMKRLSAMAGIPSASNDSISSRNEMPTKPQDGTDNDAQPTTSTSGPINSETIMQKAKELSTLDIKNLLSAVKTFKNPSDTVKTESPDKEGSKIPELAPTARRNEEYSDSQMNFDEAAYTAYEEHYNRLAREIDSAGSSAAAKSLSTDAPLTEAELVAAGLDPVSLGLRDEDLLLQEYLYDPMLQRGGIRDPLLDPYLEQELLLRELRDREALRRKAELARREAEFRKNIARPILQAQKIVETIDYSHGLKNTDGNKKDEFDGERRSSPHRDNWRRSPTRDEFRNIPYDRRPPDTFDYERRRFPPISMDERMRMRERGLPPPGMDPEMMRERGWPPGPPPFERQRSPVDPNSSFVVEEDVVRERESMERHRKMLDREKESMERRRDTANKIADSREREIERSKRERSLERLQKMERELMERERILNEREQRLKTPPRKSRDRRDRKEWRAEGRPSSRSPPRRRFEEERPRSDRRFRSRSRSRSPNTNRGRDRDPGRPRARSPPRNDSRRRDPDRDRGGRNERRSKSPDHRPTEFRDRRRFTSPSGDPVRTMSPARFKQALPKPMKIEPVMIRVEDLLNDPARQRRPKRIVIILRGLPGSGKTHIAKLIRDLETTKGVTPRVLGLDDYFLVENEKFEKDSETGRIVKRKVHEYEYEAAMEPSYRDSLLKSFKKTLEDGYFNFVIVDSINDKVSHFSEFWTAAKKAVFEVYVAELLADVHVCAKRNIHKRRLDEIQKLAFDWEETPSHMIRLDVRQMLQDSEIQEVEMGDVSDEEESGDSKKNKLTPEQLAGVPQSKWELMETNERLDKLDGIKKKKPTSSQQHMADFLSVTDDYVQRTAAPGKKRVRWADIEEKSAQRRMREVGFVVGNTDWSRMMDGDSHANQALNRTKFI
ncbi:uncharacterized protein LOC120330646 isoform X1 [Styela clava]